MKLVKSNLYYRDFEKYQQDLEKEVLNQNGVYSIDFSDLDEEIPFSSGIFRREIYGLRKNGKCKTIKTLLYSKDYDTRGLPIFNIYEYED